MGIDREPRVGRRREARVQFQPAWWELGAVPSRVCQHGVTARRAFPVTSTVPRAACWPGASTQVTWSGARASGAGVARPPGLGWPGRPRSGLPGPVRGRPRAGVGRPRRGNGGPARGERDREASGGERDLARARTRSPMAPCPRWSGSGRRAPAGGPGARWPPATRRWCRLGPSDALTVSLVAALTVAECRLASAATAAGGRAMVSVTPVGWMGLPTFATAGRRARHPDRSPGAVPRESGTGRSARAVGGRRAVAWAPGGRRGASGEAASLPASRTRAATRAAALGARRAALPVHFMRGRRSSRGARRGDRGRARRRGQA